MPTYELSVNIVGRDRASGPLRSIHSALARIAEVALGVNLAHSLERIASGFLSIASSAIEATGQIQMMEVGLSSLISRELVQLSGGLKTVSDVLPEAEIRAKGVMDELARIAILSPYQLQAVNYTYRMAMAFGYTASEATTFTKALLNVSAGVGADASMMERMAYNLAQVRLQGKVTALDIRQLALAGFDLRSVLKYVSNQMGYNIKDHLEFNDLIASGKITWQDFTTNFAKYADEMFGGASERMARTLLGLKSTFNDVWVLTIPKLIGPAVQAVVDRLNGLLNIFIDLRDNPMVWRWAATLKTRVEELLVPVDRFLAVLSGFKAYQDLKMPELKPGTTALIDGLPQKSSEFKNWGDAIRGAMVAAFGEETMGRIDGFMKIVSGIAKLATIAFGALGQVLGFIGTIKLPEGVSKNLQEGLGNLFQLLVTYGPQVLGVIGGFVARLLGLATPSVSGGMTSLSEGFLGFTETLLTNGPAMVAWLDGFLTKVTDVWIPQAEGFIKNLREGIGGALTTVSGIIRASIGPALGILTTGLVISGLVAVLPFALKIARMASALKEAATALGGWGPLLTGFKTVASLAFAPLAPAVPIILGLVGALLALGAIVTAVVIAFQNNFGGVRDILTNLGGTIIQTLKPAFDQLMTVLGPLIAAFQNLWIQLQPILMVVGAIVTYLITFVAAVVTGLIDGLIRAFSGVVMIITTIVNFVATIINSVVSVVTGLFNIIKGIVTGDGELIKQGFMQIVTGIWNILKGLWETVIGIFGGIFATVLGLISGFIEGVIGFFVNLFDRLVGHSIITDGMKLILSTFKSWFLKVTDHIKGLVNIFLNLGKDIIDGLKKGAKNAWQSFLSWFQGVIDLLPDVVKKILGISSPSKVMFRIGVDTIRGAEAGVRYRTPALATATAAAANRMIGTFNTVTQKNEFNVRNSLDAELVARRTGQYLLEMTE